MLTTPRRLSQFYHVLLRLLVPRHPPNALNSLTTVNWFASLRKRAGTASSRASLLSTERIFVRRQSEVSIPKRMSCGRTSLSLCVPLDSSELAHQFHVATCRDADQLRLLVLRSSIQLSWSLRAVEDEGIEPSTLGLQSQCSPAELIPQRGAPRRMPGRPLKTK